MKFGKALQEESKGIDDPSYSDYGNIIPNLAVGDKVCLKDNSVGIVTEIPKRNFADINVGGKIVPVHQSEIVKRLS